MYSFVKRTVDTLVPLEKYLNLLVYQLFICISFYKKPKEEANIVPSLTQGNYQFQNQYPFLKTKVSVETQEKVVILEGPSTISAHKDANN
jgi:hypothetical protein